MDEFGPESSTVFYVNEAPPQTEGHVGPPLVGVPLRPRPSTSEDPAKNLTHLQRVWSFKDSSAVFHNCLHP
jgi:hypothetical protein